MILDIGSGLSPVSPCPKETLFMDISKESLKYLEKEGYKTKYGSITEIPLKKDSVDVIFCSEVLEHIEDYEKALKEMSRVLKKNGNLILTVPVYKKYWGFDDEFVEHYRRFEPEDFKRKLKENDFKPLMEKPIGSDVERQLTRLVVRLFKKQKDNLNVGSAKLILGRAVNYALYLMVKLSLLTTNKNKTSIMLYVVERV